MLTELTPAQCAILDEVAQEYISSLTKPKKLSLPVVRKWLKVTYAAMDVPCPERVEFVDSPFAAMALASELTGTKVTSLDSVGISDSAWVARYDAYHRIGVLSNAETEDMFALRGFLRCAWDHILLDECAIVVRRPKTLRLDADGNMHSVNKPSIAWGDGHCDYSHHGVWITEKIALRPRSHTITEYKAITDTEVRRALCERAGWEWVADLLGATLQDSWKDAATGLMYTLLSCSDGTRLLRKQSPALQDGSQPVYLEPVHEDLQTARAARKWQATSLTVAECESDPELEYGIEA